jgi:prevent-host-death family protein
MTTINIHAAKTHLSRLVEEAAQGKEIVIARAGRPIAKLVPVKPSTARRRLGALRGQLRIPKTFDAPLPAVLLAAFEGR